jgi:hypothetical protein
MFRLVLAEINLQTRPTYLRPCPLVRTFNNREMRKLLENISAAVGFKDTIWENIANPQKQGVGAGVVG